MHPCTMEEADDVGEFSLISKLGEDDPQHFSVHCIEGLFEIDKDSIEVHSLLNALFLPVSPKSSMLIVLQPGLKPHCNSGSNCFDTALMKSTIQNDLCKNLTSN